MPTGSCNCEPGKVHLQKEPLSTKRIQWQCPDQKQLGSALNIHTLTVLQES